MNLQQFYGVGGAPFIEGLINYLIDKGMPKGYAPLAAIVFGFLLNLVLAYTTVGFDLKSVVASTLVTALTTNVYHEVTTPKN